MDGNVLPPERTGGGSADGARANDERRRVGTGLSLEQAVQGSQLIRGTHDHHDALAGDLSVGKRRHQLSAVPHADDV